MQVMRRPIAWRYSQFHQPLHAGYPGQLARPGLAVTLQMAGAGQAVSPVGPMWGGRWYTGMDPSDPGTYVRPYRPMPGMIAYLNYDGAAASVHDGRQGTYS